MNREELKQKLDDNHIPSNQYSLWGGTDTNKTILEWGLKWSIYEIDERGCKQVIAIFDNENDACNMFYNILIKHNDIMNKRDLTSSDDLHSNRLFTVSETGVVSLD